MSFLIGLILGGISTLTIMCCLIVGKQADNEMDKIRREDDEQYKTL